MWTFALYWILSTKRACRRGTLRVAELAIDAGSVSPTPPAPFPAREGGWGGRSASATGRSFHAQNAFIFLMIAQIVKHHLLDVTHNFGQRAKVHYITSGSFVMTSAFPLSQNWERGRGGEGDPRDIRPTSFLLLKVRIYNAG